MSGILRAFSQVLLVKDNLQLVMIGDGVDSEITKELALNLNIQDKVIFKGVLEKTDLIREINKCHFSVLFSHYETFAIVIAESLAAEKPVIATRVGAIPEILPDEFGILVEDNDEVALKNAILKMADNYKNYDGDAMREYCIENFDKEEVGRQLFSFYKSVLE
jgi:glycosyltransferase involved in cell wall biosynthesis